MTHYIYTLEFTDGSYYIGQTINVQRRMYTHRMTYGIDFTCIVIDECDSKQALLFECMWLQLFRSWGFKVRNYKPWKNVNLNERLQAGMKRKKEIPRDLSPYLVSGTKILCIDMEMVAFQLKKAAV